MKRAVVLTERQVKHLLEGAEATVALLAHHADGHQLVMGAPEDQAREYRMWTGIRDRLAQALEATAPPRDPAPQANRITDVLCCTACVDELRAIGKADAETGGSGEVSLQEYQQLDIGWTPWGIQVWCRRHQDNVVHIDLEGEQHPAT